jgi:hypothetical protein
MTGKERRKDGSGMVMLLTAEVNFSVLQCVGELPCLGDHIRADPWHCIFGAIWFLERQDGLLPHWKENRKVCRKSLRKKSKAEARSWR